MQVRSLSRINGIRRDSGKSEFEQRDLSLSCAFASQTAVYKVVSEVGIDAASMRQIADRAEVSTGTISYHFENKEKLVMAALQAAYQMPVSDDDADSSPLARPLGHPTGRPK